MNLRSDIVTDTKKEDCSTSCSPTTSGTLGEIDLTWRIVGYEATLPDGTVQYIPGSIKVLLDQFCTAEGNRAPESNLVSSA